MRLTKTKLLSKTGDGLLQQGYLGFRDSQTGSNGLFVKKIDEKYFLSLGLVISNLYDSRFTGSFYLSPTTRWGAVWGDIPKKSYQRVSYFLNKDERVSMLDQKYNEIGVIDGWWDGNNDKQVNNFIDAVKVTEPRFLSQPGLFVDIESSSDVQEMFSSMTSVITLTAHRDISSDQDFKFIPDRPIDDVPIEWFMASEIILTRQGGILNKNTVSLLGTDAWRCYQVRNRQSL